MYDVIQHNESNNNGLLVWNKTAELRVNHVGDIKEYLRSLVY